MEEMGTIPSPVWALRTIPFVPFWWVFICLQKFPHIHVLIRTQLKTWWGNLVLISGMVSVCSSVLSMLPSVFGYYALWILASLAFRNSEVRASSRLHSGPTLFRQQTEVLVVSTSVGSPYRVPSLRDHRLGATCCPMSTNHCFIYFVWFSVCFRQADKSVPVIPCWLNVSLLTSQIWRNKLSIEFKKLMS